MPSRTSLLIAALTGILWVVPSVGTQGMGTIGARVVHPDAGLIDTVPSARAQAAALLARADGVVAAALSPSV